MITMPLPGAPFTLTDSKVTPAAPMLVAPNVTPASLIVLTVFPVPVTVTVPPFVAVNPGKSSVLMFSPPLKLIAAPVLLFRKMPSPVSPIEPVKLIVPPVLFCTSTAGAAAFAIVPP